MTEPRLPDRRPLPAGRRAQLRSHLESEISARRRRTRRRTRPLVLIPAILVVGAGGAVAAGIFDTKLDDPEQVACYAQADLGARVEFIDTDFSEAPGERSGDRDATELCAPLWRRKVFSNDGNVPSLVTCVGERTARVFPGGPGTCKRLGLIALRPDDFRTQAQRRADFQRGIDELGLTRCTSPRVVRERLQRLLEKSAMAGWTIRERENVKCVALVAGSFAERELTISGKEDDQPYASADDFFGVSGPIGAEEISPAQVRAKQRKTARRYCEGGGDGDTPTLRVQNALQCLQARAHLKEKLFKAGDYCPPFAVALEVARTLTRRELGTDWRVVTERGDDSKGPLRCLTGFESDDTFKEITLVGSAQAM